MKAVISSPAVSAAVSHELPVLTNAAVQTGSMVPF